MAKLYSTVLAFFTVALYCDAQGIPLIARIDYLVENGQSIPQRKSEFQHDERGRIIGRSEFYNISEEAKANWQLLSRNESEYDDLGNVVLDRYFRYQPDEGRPNNSWLTSMSENRRTLNPAGDVISSTSTSYSYSPNGDIITFSAGRTNYDFDERGCLEAIISESNDNRDLRDDGWKENFATIYFRDDLCNEVRVERFYEGILSSYCTTDRNAFNQIILNECISNLNDTQYFRISTSQYEYDERFRQSRVINRTEEPNQGRIFFSESRYTYNQNNQFDTIVNIYFNGDEWFGGFSVHEYDDQDRNTGSSYYQFIDSTESAYRLESTNNLVYDSQDRVIASTGLSCDPNNYCYENEGYNQFNDDGKLLRSEDISRQYDGDRLVGEYMSSRELTYRCDGNLALEEHYANGELNYKVEYIYPILPPCDPISVQDNTAILPNPATTQISIWSGFLNGLETDLSIYALSGNLIQSQTTRNRNNAILNLSDVPPGSYVLTLERSGTSISKVFIKVSQ